MIRLSELVPLARNISTQISLIIQRKLREENIAIPCRKGCNTCCSYLVPLSIPEAFRLREEVLSLAEDKRKQILSLSLSSAKEILKNSPSGINLMDLSQLSHWYSNLGLECPFLENSICSNYQQRPIACREYLAMDSNLPCNPQNEDNYNKVILPVSILECLGKLYAEFENENVEAIMLPLALPWAQENLDRDMKKWPAKETISRFIEIIKESCKEQEIICNKELCKY